MTSAHAVHPTVALVGITLPADMVWSKLTRVDQGSRRLVKQL